MSVAIRWAWIGAAVLVGLLLLGLAATAVTASPRVCGSCHEMQSQVAAWKISPHNQVGCPSCHEDNVGWHRFPQTLATRSVMLQRDVASTLLNRAGESIEVTVSPIPDSRCLACHEPGREISMRFGTLIDHDEHAQENGSCLTCHSWTAHDQPVEDRPLEFMAQCFTCHGRSQDAEAPGVCEACHPPEFELRPESHLDAEWRSSHGEASWQGMPQCLLCHEERSCSDCHGMEMPHPDLWKNETHVTAATTDPGSCDNCHGPGLAFCNACHHPGYDEDDGPWIPAHPDVVGNVGAAFCVDCHEPSECLECHARTHGGG